MIQFNTYNRQTGASEEASSKITVELVKAGLFKRSYRFIADGNIIGHLDYPKSFSQKAVAIVQGREFTILRGGWWKRFIEINSPTHQQYNMRIDLSWRSKMKILDADRNPYTLKPASIWKSKWHWVDRYERPQIEIISKSFSRKNRGLIEIRETEMKDRLFWIIVSWFVIMCSESDAAAVAAM
ncbi:MAG: hypothetical protein H7122_14965 [Chitinophagaceae bacterium]|nr:hypothetical protein [Chitinophagaceae bacterium]